VEQLGAAKLLRDGRLAVEKPFGRDLASARELDARLHRLLRESQILRVDHFLGKEPVVELEYLRFANLALAELWDRKSVSCVQITMADTSFARELGEPPEPYEVLLHAAMVGDHQYFAREDSVEETWRIVQPLLDHPPDVRPYPRGSWGPEEAETLLRGHPRWQQPWLPEEG
jgi:glucose-6-phosphate 1-dehydrogenase